MIIPYEEHYTSNTWFTLTLLGNNSWHFSGYISTAPTTWLLC